jgi:Fur family transcriptional regulator, peroxide stress response regulator
MTQTQNMNQEQQFETFKNACREAGLKVTPQRLEIYRELSGTSEHPSVDVIFQKVRDRMPTISLDTVYRTLSTLEEIGAIIRVEAFDDKAHFDADTSPHHHFVCRDCGAIKDFLWAAFDSLELPGEALECGRVLAKDAVVRGICLDCLRRKDTDPAECNS